MRLSVRNETGQAAFKCAAPWPGQIEQCEEHVPQPSVRQRQQLNLPPCNCQDESGQVLAARQIAEHQTFVTPRIILHRTREPPDAKQTPNHITLGPARLDPVTS